MIYNFSVFLQKNRALIEQRRGAIIFTFRRIRSQEELEEVYKIRYQVYCTECGFESPEDHPGEIERDEYDAHSIHFIAINDREEIIGTVRLVQDSEIGFPLEKHCHPSMDTSRIPRENVAEISRLAISKTYRRREDDGLYGADSTFTDDNVGVDALHRRNRPEIVLGLLKAMYRESKWLGMVNWYLAMERSLFVLLRRYGFCFTVIGEETDYHGKRTPYISRLGSIESTLARKKPEIFKYFTGWEREEDFKI